MCIHYASRRWDIVALSVSEQSTRKKCVRFYTVYTRILAECKTQNKKDEIVVYTRITITIKINNKNHNFYTNLKGSAYMRSG